MSECRHVWNFRCISGLICILCGKTAPEKHPSDAPKHGVVRNQHPR